MILHTASEVISLCGTLENRLAESYEELSKKYPENSSLFLSLVKESKNNVKQVTRAYQEVISDAIEGCFAFEMNADEYVLEMTPTGNDTYFQALKQAISMEERVSKFYSDAAEQSKTLLADVPRTLAKIAGRRKERLLHLRSIIAEEK